VKAAERKKSPLIIQLFPWAVTFSNGLLVHTAAQAARQATVPVSVHLDHCQDEDLVKRACELPFDSIMIDMSHRSKDVNLAKTKELVAYCKARGKATEAEPLNSVE
jgi:fructose-bisphosphate aldolase class II